VFLLILFAIFAVVAALSVRLGVDSRTGSDDPRRSEYPVGIS
jgi:hypothetical protein